VITGRMWAGILFVGVVMAAGTLLVLDASLASGLIEDAGNLRYAQTTAFHADPVPALQRPPGFSAPASGTCRGR
jgi:hypothetical protein